ncbi:MAG: class II aldolase/adducin family protein [Alphaproteobacteria bacterium]|nr:class II aldolase/adducin family protein [Pseudomonadota bacterium]
MTVKQLSPIANDPQGRFGPEEWGLRVQLAAFYRLLAKFHMADLIYTHVSVQIPGPGEHYLLNPYGLLFEEVTASSLVKYDAKNNILDDSPFGINPAGYTIHTAVHKARPDALCVAHTHTRAGCAVSTMECGLLPLDQAAFFFYDRIAYNDYFYADTVEACDRMVEDLGDRRAMIMRNHGLLTIGRTIPEAFVLMYHLDKACEIQMDACATGKKLVLPPPEVCESSARAFWDEPNGGPLGQLEWDALVRRLDREDDSYKS